MHQPLKMLAVLAVAATTAARLLPAESVGRKYPTGHELTLSRNSAREEFWRVVN
jgi:hypothetical protein